MSALEDAAGDDYCYVTTTGRVTGRPHEIEIWFALAGRTLYILSGGRGRSDWVKNGRKLPDVVVRLRDRAYAGRLRVVADREEDTLARRLLLEKCRPRYAGDLSHWGRSALPIAIDLAEERP